MFGKLTPLKAHLQPSPDARGFPNSTPARAQLNSLSANGLGNLQVRPSRGTLNSCPPEIDDETACRISRHFGSSPIQASDLRDDALPLYLRAG